MLVAQVKSAKNYTIKIAYKDTKGNATKLSRIRTLNKKRSERGSITPKEQDRVTQLIKELKASAKPKSKPTRRSVKKKYTPRISGVVTIGESEITYKTPKTKHNTTRINKINAATKKIGELRKSKNKNKFKQIQKQKEIIFHNSGMLKKYAFSYTTHNLITGKKTHYKKFKGGLDTKIKNPILVLWSSSESDVQTSEGEEYYAQNIATYSTIGTEFSSIGDGFKRRGFDLTQLAIHQQWEKVDV